jgi:hypothetical protein
MHKLSNFIWNKEELHHQWTQYIILPICKKMVIKLHVVIIETYHCYQLHTKFTYSLSSHVQLTLKLLKLLNCFKLYAFT